MEVRFLSGETLTQLGADEFQGTAKALKQSLAAQIGASRFRQKLFLDGSEILDDEVFGSEPVKLLLVVDFCPADAEEQKMLLAIADNDLVALEFLRRPYNPNMILNDDVAPLQSAAARGHLEAMQLLIEAGAELEILASGLHMLCRAVFCFVQKMGIGPQSFVPFSTAKMINHESGVPNFQTNHFSIFNPNYKMG